MQALLELFKNKQTSQFSCLCASAVVLSHILNFFFSLIFYRENLKKKNEFAEFASFELYYAKRNFTLVRVMVPSTADPSWQACETAEGDKHEYFWCHIYMSVGKIL